MQISPQDIDAYLSQIEYEYDIRIIGSWNIGSQAWGLASDQSDWDIGCIFTQPLTNYALIHNYTETIDIEGTSLNTIPQNSSISAKDIDFMGWDIKRYLELLTEDNPSALELLHSDEGYRVHETLTNLKEYTDNHFSVIQTFKHYQSLTKNMYKTYIESEKEPTVKKNLVAIRSLIHGWYILETHEYPDMHFPTLLENAPDTVLEHVDMEQLNHFITQKQNGNGHDEIGNPFKTPIEQFIDYDMNELDHVRDDHKTDTYHCDHSRCNGTIRSHDVDKFMYELLQSRTLLQ